MFVCRALAIYLAAICASAQVIEVYSAGSDLRRTADFSYDPPATPIFASSVSRGMAIDSAAGKIYWSESGTAQLLRANLDGSGQETIVSSLSGPEGIALDLSNGKVYWADEPASRVSRANLDGTGAEILVMGLGSPHGIALDLAGGKVYWTELTTDIIGRANLDGSSPETFLGVTTGLTPAIAVDGAAGRVYWFESGAGKIFGSDTDGSNLTEIDPSATMVEALALDETENVLYAAPDDGTPRIDLYDLESGVKRTAALLAQAAPAIAFGGAAPALWWSIPSMNALGVAPFAIADVLGDVSIGGADIEIDIPRSTMYWTEWDLANPGARVMRANLDGTGVEALFPAETSAFGIALDIDAETLYWSDALSSRIYRSDLDGANRETLIDGAPAASPMGVEIDPAGGNLYWANSGTGEIGRADLDGQNAQVIVIGLGSPLGLALDATNGKLYWTDRGADAVQRADLDGTNVETIASTADLPGDIEADPVGGKIYWTEYASNAPPELWRANLDGTDAELLADTGLWPFGLALRLPGDPGFQGGITSNIPPSNVHAGDHLILTAPAGSAYQWKRNDMDISGANGLTLVFPSVAMSDAGDYTVRYDNGFKAVVDSLPFELTVIEPAALPMTLPIGSGAVVVFAAMLLLLVGCSYAARGVQKGKTE